MASRHTLVLNNGNPLMYWRQQPQGCHFYIRNEGKSFYMTGSQVTALGRVALEQLQSGEPLNTECLVIRFDGTLVHIEQYGNSYGICIEPTSFEQLTAAIAEGAVDRARTAYAMAQVR